MITGSRACLRARPRPSPRGPDPAPEAPSTRTHRLNDAPLDPIRRGSNIVREVQWTHLNEPSVEWAADYTFKATVWEQ
jgi:hypothetical protein